MKAKIQMFNQNDPIKCESGPEESYGRQLSFYLSRLQCWLQTRLSVIRGCHAGNLIVTTFKESASNDRVFVGLVMLAVSPVLWWAHLFFDWNE